LERILTLKDLGFTDALEEFRIKQKLDESGIGRIVAEYRERYLVRTVHAEFDAEITGNMRFSAGSREDFPAVGDWVTLTPYDTCLAIIHRILPRFSIIKRQAVGQFGEIQIIAANIDYALLVQAVDRDFNINRLERYLTICHSSKVSPIIVLSKTDLMDDPQVSEILETIKRRIQDVPVIAISNETQNGYGEISKTVQKGKTYCLLGSSGVGKSTLLNNLSGKAIMKTDEISQSANRGKHITSHRELVVLENGGILVDNPGMREVGIADTEAGLETTFDKVIRLARKCKFQDCTHTTEIGCAVLEAVEKGDLDRSSYENYLRLEREKAHFDSTVSERRKKDKEFGKMVKKIKKDLNKRLD